MQRKGHITSSHSFTGVPASPLLATRRNSAQRSDVPKPIRTRRRASRDALEPQADAVETRRAVPVSPLPPPVSHRAARAIAEDLRAADPRRMPPSSELRLRLCEVRRKPADALSMSPAMERRMPAAVGDMSARTAAANKAWDKIMLAGAAWSGDTEHDSG